MCGIVGAFSSRPLACADSPDRLDRAIDSIAHRGPDDRGHYLTADRRAFLGHRRLSIIDLSGGHQPLVDSSGQVRLIYNGEIYNHKALRATCEQRGYRFGTHSDGEVVLPLYRDDQKGFVHHLHGMFALAILDERLHRLTLVRDRNGIKPLYWATIDNTFYFASELKALLALLPERPPLSTEALRAFLRWKYIPDPQTIFAGIHRLRRGEMLQVSASGGQLKIERSIYWRPEFGVAKRIDERAAVEELDRRLKAAVVSHLESDVEVGTLLSGGVDSSLVTALAAQASSRRIKTFSVGFGEAGFDQLPYARTLAQRYSTEHHEELVEWDPIAAVERMVLHFDEPFADSSALACLRVCEVAAKHVKVVLTGDGGDESFGGYKRYDDLLHAPQVPAWKRVALRVGATTSSALFSPEAKFARRLRYDACSPLAQHELRQELCSEWLIQELVAPSQSSTRTPALSLRGEGVSTDPFQNLRAEAGANWSELDIAQYVDLSMYLPGDILTKVDRTSMACSLECRVPLLDHAITEFSASLAPELKIHNGVRKYLLKRVAERYVPHELIHRPKMGFRIPIRRWFKGELLHRTATLLRDGSLVNRRILNRGSVEWVISAQRLPWMDFGSQLWALLFLEHWARVYLPS